MEVSMKTILKIVAAIVILLVVLDVRVSWQQGMPDSGEVICSLKSGKGYVVVNDVRGVFLRRAEALDSECAKVKQ
jgi:hypothetical protein